MPAMPQESELLCERVGLCPTLGIGLTKREQAAIQILAGLVANQFNDRAKNESLANRAIDLADKLFDRLEK